MGLLLLEIMASAGRSTPLHELVVQLQKEYGPTCYQRDDFHLQERVNKHEMSKRLADSAPAHLAGQSIQKIHTHDGVKFVLADESWLLIRPSGTEPVLRVYAEGTSHHMVTAILHAGRALVGIN